MRGDRSALTVGVTLVSALLGASLAVAGPLLGGRGQLGSTGVGGSSGLFFPLLLRTADLSAEQEQQVADVMARHGERVQPLREELAAAHRDVERRLLGPGGLTAEAIAPGIARIEALRRQLLEEWTRTALEVRAVLTPAQLARAAEAGERLGALPAELARDACLGPSAGAAPGE